MCRKACRRLFKSERVCIWFRSVWISDSGEAEAVVAASVGAGKGNGGGGIAAEAEASAEGVVDALDALLIVVDIVHAYTC